MFLGILLCVVAWMAFTCGHDSTRIIGGLEVEDVQDPGDVSMRRRVKGELRHMCGGVLVHPRWILTAAHCLVNSEAREWEVHVARIERHRVDKFVMRQYDKYTGRNDLALVRLRRPSSQGVTKLPDSEFKATGNCSVSGYGVTSARNNTLPSVLHKAWVRVVEHSKCQALLGKYQQLSQDSLCAGGGKSDACQGDSGSPLICQATVFNGKFSLSGQEVVAGIVSAGFFGCATPGVPGIYASVAWHRPWVDWVLSSTAKYR